jgi:hypothetical protein
MGAAIAMALVLPGGVAFADDTISPVPIPTGTLALGDGFGVGGAPVVEPGDPEAPYAPLPLDQVAVLTVCAFAAPSCAGAGSMRAALDLAPAVLRATAGLSCARPPACVTPTTPPSSVASGPRTSPASTARTSPPASSARTAPPVDCGVGAPSSARRCQQRFSPTMGAFGLVVGTRAAPGPPPATTDPDGASAGQQGGPLASTGTPVVAALAGLVLLAMGGLLTWRTRG